MGSYTVARRSSTMIIGIHCKTSNAPEAGPLDIDVFIAIEDEEGA